MRRLLETRRGLVVACDFDALSRLTRLAEALEPTQCIVGYKIGFALALRHGLKSVAEALRNLTGALVIYDHQKAGTDIPATGTTFAAVCADAGVDGTIVFPQAGRQTLSAYVEALMATTVVPIVGAVMTHRTFLAREGGYLVNDIADQVYASALRLGVTHFVVPGTKAATVSDLLREAEAIGVEPIVFSPGFGRQGGETPAAIAAFRGLAWAPIVGSAIYEAKDPANTVVTLARTFGFISGQ